MSNSSSTYLHFCSYKSIQDQFIDDCLQTGQTGIKSKQDFFIQDDLKIFSEACISIAEIGSEKFIGRWSVEESFVYLDVLKHCQNTKSIIKGLVQRLPTRIESQIRAHHQKMIKKYGSREKILECLNNDENYHMMKINRKLSSLNLKLSQLTNMYPNDFPQ